MFNRVFEVGQVIGDPSERSTSKGTRIVEFVVKVDGGYWGKDGAFVPQSDSMTFMAFGKTCDSIIKHIKSGMLVAVEGKVKVSEWNDKRRNDLIAISVTEIEWFPPKVSEREPVDDKPEDKEDLPF